MSQPVAILLLLGAVALGAFKAATGEKEHRIGNFILWFLVPFFALGLIMETCSSMKERSRDDYWDYHEREYNP
jgi:hypothetical protein